MDDFLLIQDIQRHSLITRTPSFKKDFDDEELTEAFSALDEGRCDAPFLSAAITLQN